MKIKLTYDSRDKIFSQRFGQAVDIPPELNLDSKFHDEIQPIGNVQCVAFSTCDIAEDQKKLEFDRTSVDDLWGRVPSTPQGSDPRDVLKEAIRGGLLPKNKKERLVEWRSFWRADEGRFDPFENLRSTMSLIQSPVMIGTFWYQNWHNPANDILPVGKGASFGHAYTCEGWKQINGEPHLIIEAWVGKKLYMPRETFNEAMKPWGMQTWVLSTSEIDAKKEKDILESLKDILINLLIKLRDILIEEKAKLELVPEPVELELGERVYQEARMWLGKDASPDNNAPEELACVESICHILQRTGVEIPMMLSTIELKKWLDKNFERTTEAQRGNLVISVTGTGNGRIKHGHAGIWGEGWIMSNSSSAKMWLENYTIDTWVKRYRTEGGMRVLYYKPVV